MFEMPFLVAGVVAVTQPDWSLGPPPLPSLVTCRTSELAYLEEDEGEDNVGYESERLELRLELRRVDDRTLAPKRELFDHDTELMPLDYVLYFAGEDRPELACWSATTFITCPYSRGMMATYYRPTGRFQFVDHAGWFLGEIDGAAVLGRGNCEERND